MHAEWLKTHGYAYTFRFWGSVGKKNYHNILGAFDPKTPKLGVKIGFSMQMKMFNISKTVRDQAIICMGNI